MTNNNLQVSAPGRICLFGEHQDYLGLPVITAAINKRIAITGRKNDNKIFNINLPDINDQEIIDLDGPVKYIKERDYFRSAINVLLRDNVQIKNGYDCVVEGNIPINSGTSSSSALVVAWVKFLLKTAGDKRWNDPMEVARFAHQAEVLEFDEPGGMMDHYAASFGSVLYIDFEYDEYQVMDPDLDYFVLGDSREPKDTKGILSRVKNQTVNALNVLNKLNKHINIYTLVISVLNDYKSEITPQQFELLKANLINREITQRARDLFDTASLNRQEFGNLLNAHQKELRDGLKISTPKIDRMIEASLEAGALGAKINGSGGGGCMFAYAPDSYENVATAISKAGGKPYIIAVDEGAIFLEF